MPSVRACFSVVVAVVAGARAATRGVGLRTARCRYFFHASGRLQGSRKNTFRAREGRTYMQEGQRAASKSAPRTQTTPGLDLASSGLARIPTQVSEKISPVAGRNFLDCLLSVVRNAKCKWPGTGPQCARLCVVKLEKIGDCKLGLKSCITFYRVQPKSFAKHHEKSQKQMLPCPHEPVIRGEQLNTTSSSLVAAGRPA